MLLSMTGFGSSELATPWGKMSLEVQSLNRRHLEIQIYLPPEFSYLEGEIRKEIASLIYRGCVLFRLKIQWEEKRYLPKKAVLKKIKQEWEEMASYLQMPQTLTLSFLMERWKELGEREEQNRKEVHSHVEKLTKKALKKLLEMRKEEGVYLQKDICQRLKKIEQQLSFMQKQIPVLKEEGKKKLQEKLALFLPQEEEKKLSLLKEILSFLEKSDITEETVRLFSHLQQFQKVVDTEKGACGRKLEFLVQEMMRETSTICAKAPSPAIIFSSLEIKGEIEKIKEQLQNIE